MSDVVLNALPDLIWAAVAATALCVGAVVLAGAASFLAFVASRMAHAVGHRRA